MNNSSYKWTLAALVTVYCFSVAAGSFVPDLIDKFAAFGLGTVTGGLIGVLRSPNSNAGSNNGTP